MASTFAMVVRPFLYLIRADSDIHSAIDPIYSLPLNLSFTSGTTKICRLELRWKASVNTSYLCSVTTIPYLTWWKHVLESHLPFSVPAFTATVNRYKRGEKQWSVCLWRNVAWIPEIAFYWENVKVDSITCYLSRVQSQTWQLMNSLLMDGQEQRWK